MTTTPSLKTRGAPLRRCDVEAAGALLGRAFVDDPVIRYYFPAEANRLRLCRTLMTVATSLSLTYGQAHTLFDGADLRAVGLMLPPSRHGFPITGIVRVLATRPALWRPRSIFRYFGVAESVEANRATAPLWTLMTLGVDVAHQQRGHGSDLLTQVLQSIAPAAGIFLETYKESNLGFYQKHGFEIDRTFATHGGQGPKCWTMMRH